MNHINDSQTPDKKNSCEVRKNSGHVIVMTKMLPVFNAQHVFINHYNSWCSLTPTNTTTNCPFLSFPLPPRKHSLDLFYQCLVIIHWNLEFLRSSSHTTVKSSRLKSQVIQVDVSGLPWSWIWTYTMCTSAGLETNLNVNLVGPFFHLEPWTRVCVSSSTGGVKVVSTRY